MAGKVRKVLCTMGIMSIQFVYKKYRWKKVRSTNPEKPKDRLINSRNKFKKYSVFKIGLTFHCLMKKIILKLRKSAYCKVVSGLRSQDSRKSLFSVKPHTVLTIHKDRIVWKNLLENKEMVFKNEVKNIQTMGYNGARMVDSEELRTNISEHISRHLWEKEGLDLINYS